jgi:hypothetical protein
MPCTSELAQLPMPAIAILIGLITAWPPFLFLGNHVSNIQNQQQQELRSYDVIDYDLFLLRLLLNHKLTA